MTAHSGNYKLTTCRASANFVWTLGISRVFTYKKTSHPIGEIFWNVWPSIGQGLTYEISLWLIGIPPKIVLGF